MDRNAITGIIIILAMLFGYEYFMGSSQTEESVKTEKLISDSKNNQSQIIKNDSLEKQVQAEAEELITIEEQSFHLENKDIKVEISNIGGNFKTIQLLNYYSYQDYNNGEKKGIELFQNQRDKFEIKLPVGGELVNLNTIYFQEKSSEKNRILLESLPVQGHKIYKEYEIDSTGFIIHYKLGLQEIAGSFSGSDIQINWIENVTNSEKNIEESRKSTINYFLTKDEEFDYLTENPSNAESIELDQSISWVTFKRKYFLSGIIPNGFTFSKASLKSTPNLDDSTNVKTLSSNIVLGTNQLINGALSFDFYYGPNDYSIIKNITEDFGANVKLSYDFLLPITKYIYIPLFNFLESIFSNYGILIIVLVLIIKTALLPLTYRSYVSMAKTRMLQPEIAAIKEKVGNDAAKVQQETMKLYGEVGVNPLSGCVPILATMPILMAVFMLFPNLINLRQESFLWANDLSTFDSILNLPFTIPFYGNHISLFCLLMTVSQLVYGYYNNQMTPSQEGQPIDMKKMAYITPVVFMFVMNSFPAGLSFYYFISNLVTIGQQILIKRFINEDKIKAILEENRKKIKASGGKKSKFSQMLQAQMKAMEEQQKNKGKK